MPQLTFQVTQTGLTLPVYLGVSGAQTTSLVATNQPIPSLVRTKGLVDTGTDVTCIPPWVAQQLGLSWKSSGSTHTAGGQTSVVCYEVSLSITDPTVPNAPMFTVADLLVMELKAHLPGADVLVGLDVLLELQLFLAGPKGWFTLTF